MAGEVTRLFHRTAAAAQILAGGFRDGEGSYLCAGLSLRGVFVADRPVDANEGARGGELLEVLLPAGIGLADYELVEDGKPYREWCVPAALLNEHATVRLMNPDEEDDL